MLLPILAALCRHFEPPAAKIAPKRGQVVPHSIEKAEDGLTFPHYGSHLPPWRPPEAIWVSFSLICHAFWNPLGSIFLIFHVFVVIIFSFLTFASRASRPGTNYHWAEASVTTTRARWRGRGFAALKRYKYIYDSMISYSYMFFSKGHSGDNILQVFMFRSLI